MDAAPAGTLITPLWGNLHPVGDDRVEPAAAAAALRRVGVLGAVADGDPRPGASVELMVLVDAERRVWRLGEGARATGDLLEVTELLADATGHAVDLDDLSCGPTGTVLDEQGFWVPATTGTGALSPSDLPDEEPEPADPELVARMLNHGFTKPHPDVMLTHVDEDMLGLLARDVGSSLTWAAVDGWNLVRFDEVEAQLHEHAFLGDEVPTVALTRIVTERHVSVLTRRGVLPEYSLHREPVMLPSWDAAALTEHGVDPDVTATLAEVTRWCGNQHLEEDSDAARLLAEPAFAGCDLETVAAALAAPADDQWSAGVLTALGLPRLAADVHEGRAEIPGAVTVEPQGLWATVRGVVRRERALRKDRSRPRRHGS